MPRGTWPSRGGGGVGQALVVGALAAAALGCSAVDTDSSSASSSAPPPWLLSLQEQVSDRSGHAFWRHRCGAALVSDTVALTAAHCVEELSAVDIAHLRVVAGELRPVEPRPEARVGAVRSVAIHPQRSAAGGSRERAYDAAILRLDGSLARGGEPVLGRSPSALSEALATNEPAATFAGWGQVKPGDTPGLDFRAFSVRAATPDDAPLYPAARAAWTDLVVTVREEGNSCHFDSGGPLYRAGSSPVLLGIASGTATSEASWLYPCKVGAFVRFDVIAPWLNDALRDAVDP